MPDGSSRLRPLPPAPKRCSLLSTVPASHLFGPVRPTQSALPRSTTEIYPLSTVPACHLFGAGRGRSTSTRTPGIHPAQPSAGPSFCWRSLIVSIETPTEGRGGYSRITVSPTARYILLAAVVRAVSGQSSYRRDCHFSDALSIPIETPTKGRGGCSRMTAPPTARPVPRGVLRPRPVRARWDGPVLHLRGPETRNHRPRRGL